MGVTTAAMEAATLADVETAMTGAGTAVALAKVGTARVGTVVAVVIQDKAAVGSVFTGAASRQAAAGGTSFPVTQNRVRPSRPDPVFSFPLRQTPP